MKDISVCGIDCAIACTECNSMHDELKQKPCRGCNAEKGQIFWVKFMGLDTCPIYACATNKPVKHCGECAELPCKIYFEMKDPSISEEQHQQGIRDRVEVLKNL
jgi:hypothetical protein